MSNKKQSQILQNDLSPQLNQQQQLEPQIDPYSTIIVDDLLQGTTEWRQVSDIVKLTFKALTDVVKTQGESIKEMEKVLPTRASKNELNTGLSLKSNISDVSRTISEIASSLDGKISYDDVQLMLKDYITRTDFQYSLSSKLSVEDMKQLIEQKANHSDLSAEIANFSIRLEEFQKEFAKRMADTVQQKDFENVLAQLEQKANIQEMNDALESKANKQSIANALHRKANRADIEAILGRKADISDLQNIVNQLQSKADIQQLDNLTQIIHNKSDKNDFNLVTTNLSNKADKQDSQEIMDKMHGIKRDLEKQIGDYQKQIDKLSLELEKFKTQISYSKNVDTKEYDRMGQKLESKVDSEVMKGCFTQLKNELYEDLTKLRDDIQYQIKIVNQSQLDFSNKDIVKFDQIQQDLIKINDQHKSVVQDLEKQYFESQKIQKSLNQSQKNDFELKIQDDIEQIKKSIEEFNIRKIDKKEYIEMKSKIVSAIEKKIDCKDIQNIVASNQTELTQKIIDFQDDCANKLKQNKDEFQQLMNQKLDKRDVNDIISQFQQVKAEIMETIEIQEIKQMKQVVGKIIEVQEGKLGQKEFNVYCEKLGAIIELIKKDVYLKANIQDVCTLLDTKANVDDTNKALQDIHVALEKKANQEEVTQIVSDQAIINESLCTENVIGRWSWKSGEIKQMNQIPWENQITNTLPDNFLWEKGKPSILIVQAGLYQISGAFFSKKKPNIQLIINGDPVMSSIIDNQIGSNQNIRLKEYGKYPSGNIIGTSINDFVNLPQRSRITIQFEGEIGAEGFLNVKKL